MLPKRGTMKLAAVKEGPLKIDLFWTGYIMFVLLFCREC